MTGPPDLLVRLVREAQAEAQARQQVMPISHLEGLAAALPAPRSLSGALRAAPGLGVIAEMKARTPLLGRLGTEYSPGRLSRLYTEAGATAISVLCQETSFGGHPEHLAEARAVSGLPLLRKDFIVEDYQVVEARAFGGDAVLLIAAALEPGRLAELVSLALRLGMDALVEVHGEAEVETAVRAGARMIGVNHRNLRTFEVDIGLTGRLRALVPAECVLVAESGVQTAADAIRVWEAGADAILVGEALMRAADPAAKLRELKLVRA